MSVSAQYFLSRCALTGVLPTGDEGVPAWVYILMSVSLVVIIALALLGGKNRNDENDDNENN